MYADILKSQLGRLLGIDLGVYQTTLGHLPSIPGDGFSLPGREDPTTAGDIRDRIQTMQEQTRTSNLGGMLLAYALLRLEAAVCLQLFKSVGETPMIDTIHSLETHATKAVLAIQTMAENIRTQACYCGMDGTMACSILSHAAAYVSDIWETIPDTKNQGLFTTLVDTNKEIMEEVGLANMRRPSPPMAFHCGQPLVFEMDDF